MCSGEKLSYSAFPAGHIFRLGIAILVLTGNCVVMRVAATIALLSVMETQTFCQQHRTACGVTAYSVLGSVLPILIAVLTGSFAIVAAKRYLKWAFIVTFALGCVLMTISFLLNLLFNGLRHGFNIAPVLVPDILEINMFCVINLLTMVTGILCVKSLVRDRSERYLASANAAAYAGPSASSSMDLDGAVAETEIGRESRAENGRGRSSANRNGAAAAAASSSSLRPPESEDRSGRRQDRLHRSGSRLSARSESRVDAEVTVMVENESGKVTNFDIFKIGTDGKRQK